MVTIHMLVGIPGSGKTTYAKKLAEKLCIPTISSDQMRNEHPDASEDKIWPMLFEKCGKMVVEGKDFIYDATNITPKVRLNFINKVKEYSTNFQVGTYYFDVDPLICFNRAKIRNNMPGERFIPPEVILSYGQKIIPPSEEEGFIFMKVIKND